MKFLPVKHAKNQSKVVLYSSQLTTETRIYPTCYGKMLSQWHSHVSQNIGFEYEEQLKTKKYTHCRVPDRKRRYARRVARIL